VEVSVAVAAGVADGLVEVAPGVVGVAVGLVEFGSAVGEVRVGEGDGLDCAAGSCTGSHDSPLVVVAVLAAAVLAATVRLAPEAASRTLPAISVTIAGRACVKRMKRPTSAARRGMSPIGYRAPRGAIRSPTRLAVVITVIAVNDRDGSGQKVNLRIRNVAYSMLVVTLPVRSVFLPGS
jgi:hypothetical protein